MQRSEFQLIKALTQQFSKKTQNVLLGIGDDCAHVQHDPQKDLLYTVDSLVETVHFSRKYFKPQEVGYKAVAVSVSDIAAMGGKPLYIFISLGLPRNIQDRWVDGFYKGVKKACADFNVQVLGGNCTRTPKVCEAHVFVVGEIKRGNCKYRSSAKPGDAIFVTGSLGDSAVGLKLLKTNPKDRTFPSLKHRMPTPRVAEGEFLGTCLEVGAVIDISDGFLQDLNHILKASGVTAEIFNENIPKNKWSLASMALTGGEDYELLFTVRKKNIQAFKRKWKKEFAQITFIGNILDKKMGFRLMDKDGQVLKMKKGQGFSHF